MPWISEEIAKELQSYLQSQSSIDKKANKLNKNFSKEIEPKTLNSVSSWDIFLGSFIGVLPLICLAILFMLFSPQKIHWFFGTNFGLGGHKAQNGKVSNIISGGIIEVKESSSKIDLFYLCNVFDIYSRDTLSKPETIEYLSNILEKGGGKLKGVKTQQNHLVFVKNQGETININSEMIEFLDSKIKSKEPSKSDSSNRSRVVYVPEEEIMPFAKGDCSYPHKPEYDPVYNQAIPRRRINR